MAGSTAQAAGRLRRAPFAWRIAAPDQPFQSAARSVVAGRRRPQPPAGPPRRSRRPPRLTIQEATQERAGHAGGEISAVLGVDHRAKRAPCGFRPMLAHVVSSGVMVTAPSTCSTLGLRRRRGRRKETSWDAPSRKRAAQPFGLDMWTAAFGADEVRGTLEDLAASDGRRRKKGGGRSRREVERGTVARVASRRPLTTPPSQRRSTRRDGLCVWPQRRAETPPAPIGGPGGAVYGARRLV